MALDALHSSLLTPCTFFGKLSSFNFATLSSRARHFCLLIAQILSHSIMLVALPVSTRKHAAVLPAHFIDSGTVHAPCFFITSCPSSTVTLPLFGHAARGNPGQHIL